MMIGIINPTVTKKSTLAETINTQSNEEKLPRPDFDKIYQQITTYSKKNKYNLK